MGLPATAPPSQVQRPCAGRCGRLVPTSQLRCPGCEAEYQAKHSYAARRKARGQPARLSEKVRQQVLERDGHRCTDCGAQEGQFAFGAEVKVQVDHVHDPADDRPENLVTRCARCHRIKHGARRLS